MSATVTADAALAAHIAEITAAVETQPILRLEHAMIRVGDLAAGVDWYQRVLGFGDAGRDARHAYLTCGGEPGFDLALTDAEPGHGLDHVAYSVHDEETLDRFGDVLSQRGIAATRASDPEPGVRAVLRFALELAATEMELIVREQRPAYQVCNEWGPEGVAGPLDINHVTYAGGDPQRFSEFMVDVLKFRVSDVWIPRGSGTMRMAFLRVGENHHDAAMLEGDTVGLHHTAFLVRDVGALATLSDRVRRVGEVGETGIVRHMPGNNMAFYVRDPWKNRTELTTDIARLNDPRAGVQVWDQENPVDLYNLWAPIEPPRSWIEDVT